MVTEKERRAIWESMLEADYQKRYWYAKSASYIKIDRNLQIALAVLSSSAVLTALGDLQMQLVWKWLSAATAIVATVLPFMNYTRKSVSMAEVASKWHVLENEYTCLWREIDKSVYSEEKFNKLKNQEIEIVKGAVDLPMDDQKIQGRCFKQVLKEKGV